MKRTGFRSVDDYVAAQADPAQASLTRVREAIRKALPGAIESISYQIPAYKLEGRAVLYFAGFDSHYSVYPASARVVRELGKELAGRLKGKATIRFPYDEAVPVRLIGRIAKIRAAEAAEIEREKLAKKGRRS